MHTHKLAHTAASTQSAQDGDDALMCACRAKRLDVVSALLRHGATVRSSHARYFAAPPTTAVHFPTLVDLCVTAIAVKLRLQWQPASVPQELSELLSAEPLHCSRCRRRFCARVPSVTTALTSPALDAPSRTCVSVWCSAKCAASSEASVQP